MPKKLEAYLQHSKYYLKVLGKARELYFAGKDAQNESLRLFDCERVNIENGQQASVTFMKLDRRMASICSEYPDKGIFLIDLRLHPNVQIVWLLAALEAAKQLQDVSAEGRHAGNLGNAYSDLSELEKALSYYEKHREIAHHANDDRGEANAIGNIANIYYARGNSRKAIDLYKSALGIHQKIRERRGEATTLVNLGAAFSTLGDLSEAVKYYEQALNIFNELGDLRSQGITLGNLGMANADLGNFEIAIKFYERRLNIARDMKDSRSECNVLCNLGLAYANLGEVERAYQLYADCMRIAVEVGDRLVYLKALANTGDLLLNQGRLAEANQHLTDALTLTREIGDRFLEGRTLNTLGICHRDNHELNIAYFDEALEIAVDIGDRLGEHNALRNKANVYKKIGRFEDAKLLYERCEQIVGQSDDATRMMEVLGDLGDIHFMVKLYADAVSFYNRQNTLAERLGAVQDQVTSLLNMGRAYRELGDTEQAMSLAMMAQLMLSKDADAGLRKEIYEFINQLK